MKILKAKYTLKQIAAGILFILPFFMQCQKKTDMDLSLAVNSNELHLEAIEGKTHIMVYADGAWNVTFAEDVDWISVNKLQGNGNSDITFAYSQNFGVARSVTLILSKGNERQEIRIIQKGLDVAVRFGKTKFVVPKNGLPTILPILSNLKYDFDQVDFEYLYDDETSEQWVSNARLTEDGFIFDALENTAGRKRSVRIYMTVVDGFGNEMTSFTDVDQSLDNAMLAHQYGSTSYLTRSAKLDTVVLKSNVGVHFPLMETNITYYQGADWIEEVTLTNDSLLILAVRENTSGLERNADVDIRLAIKGMNLVQLTHHVYQSAEDYDYYKAEDLTTLIAMPSGTTTIVAPLKVLQAIVVSDEGNANIETNPNTKFNAIDLDETYRTAYIQSVDGKYGFRLKFTDKNENTLKRYSKVNISLDGLTLEKEANPTRYTIKGLTSSAIVKNEAGTASNVVSKLKYIAELTDVDMYTYVTLRDVSIAVPYGTYMNVNRGYVMKTAWNTQGTTGPYTDAIPTNVYDRQGSDINMLVNATAAWGRNTLPQGSGTIAGVLTHSKLLRYGGGEGNVGRYTIRPLDPNDIQLDGSAIAKTLVEWNWMVNGTNACAIGQINKDGSGKILPLIGTSATLSCTVNEASSGTGFHPVCYSNPDSKTIYNNGFQYTGVKWWNATENKGEGFVLQFSTSGVSAQSLILNFTMGGGSGGDGSNHIPTYWEIEYSLDGITYTVLPNSTYAVRPLVGWGLNRPFLTPGLMPFTFELPTSLLNKSNVYVKMKAKSSICATATGAENGVITSTMTGTSMRLGVVSVKYIQ
ncbi:BACON domain-containing protein [Sphingobacterium sp. SGG-5]|uniref:BACON domain-containing protein n=1 Tax=Sphingobacterium sp. SGG-5 TaxID=2710881 RepID=UPI0013EB3E3C|nr:BACON domain-containing carbohydrate-binding protein [Sphingobacterium sp. SGG-5]NGM60296.1 BACON domain-containing protein [Sphingobacterium sp. SGG-5]